MYIEKIAS
jgi:hypothetical protein